MALPTFRIVWPIAMVVTFVATLRLVLENLPAGRSALWDVVVFLALGMPFGLLANSWGPLLVYRARVATRARWAARNGYRVLGEGDVPGIAAEVRRLFRRPERGIVMGVLQGAGVTLVDYCYLRRYSGEGAEAGIDVREAVTVAICDLAGPSAEAPRASTGLVCMISGARLLVHRRRLLPNRDLAELVRLGGRTP